MSLASLFLFSMLVVFSLSSIHAAPVVNSTEISHRDDYSTIDATALSRPLNASKSTDSPQTRITTLSPNDPLAHNITPTDQHSIETTTLVTKPPLPSTEPPPQVTTTHVIDVAKIKYDIMKKINALSLNEIVNLLEDYDIDTLPYALGYELGYDDERDAEHFQYLVDQGGKELRATLLYEKEKKSKMAPPPPPTAKPEPPKDSSSNEPIVPNGGKTHHDENEGGESNNLNPYYENDAKPDQQEGPASNSDGLGDGKAPAGDHNGSDRGPPDDENEYDMDANDKGPNNKGQTGTEIDPQRGYLEDNVDVDGFDAFPGDDSDNGNTGLDDIILFDFNEGGEKQLETTWNINTHLVTSGKYASIICIICSLSPHTHNSTHTSRREK